MTQSDDAGRGNEAAGGRSATLAAAILRINASLDLDTVLRLKAARAMLRDGRLTIREIAEQLDVSRSTLYRHFPEGRDGVQ